MVKKILKKTTLLLLFGAFMQSCCLLMPRARTSEVTVNVTPSNASIYDYYGKLIGTDKTVIYWPCSSDKYATRTITIKAPGYRTQTQKITNYRYNYTKTYNLEKKVDTHVKVSVTPSNANIFFYGRNIGTGSCTLTYDEDDASNSYHEITCKAPYYYDKTVRVLKSDGYKKITLDRKPIKTIVTVPSDADIYINNNHVAQGSYDISFENTDRVQITLEKIGYETATYTLMKNDSRQTITYKLEEDEAYANSYGPGEAEVDFINKWLEIIPRKNMSEDDVWRRMIATISNDEYFEQLDKTDKASGWIRTFPQIHSYTKSDVRVTLEIKPDYSTGDLRYKVRLLFEKRKKDSGEEGWKKYDRGLKKYLKLYDELINSVGENKL